jgi:hypothetical protein
MLGLTKKSEKSPNKIKNSKLGGWKNILAVATMITALAQQSCVTTADTIVEDYQHVSVDINPRFIHAGDSKQVEVHYDPNHSSISYLEQISSIDEDYLEESRPIIELEVDTAFTQKPMKDFSFTINRTNSNTGEIMYSIKSDTLESKPVQIFMVQDNFKTADMGYRYMYVDNSCEDKTCDYVIETNQYDFTQKNPLGKISGDGKGASLLAAQEIVLLLEKQGFDFENANDLSCTVRNNGDGTAQLVVHVEENRPFESNYKPYVSIYLKGPVNGPTFEIDTVTTNNGDYTLNGSYESQGYYDSGENRTYQNTFVNHTWENNGPSDTNLDVTYTIRPNAKKTDITVETNDKEISCPVTIKMPNTTPGVTQLGNECPMIQALKQDQNVFVTTYDESGKLVLPQSQVQTRDRNYFSLGSDMATGVYMSVYWYEYEGRFYQIFKQGVKEVFQTGDSGTNKGKTMVLGNFNEESLNTNLPKSVAENIIKFSCQ